MRGPLAETRGRCSARGGGSGWGSRTRMSNCATFGMLHASDTPAWRARYGAARLRGYPSGCLVTDQRRKITVRCTMKLMLVATPCATMNATVISPVIGGSNPSITAFIPIWTAKVIP